MPPVAESSGTDGFNGRIVQFEVSDLKNKGSEVSFRLKVRHYAAQRHAGVVPNPRNQRVPPFQLRNAINGRPLVLWVVQNLG